MSEYQNLFAALAKAQGEMDALIASSTANIKSDKAAYSYKYADLADVLRVALKTLSKHSLGIVQIPEVAYEQNTTTVSIAATLFHASGEFMPIAPLALRVRPGATAQEVGSAITYGRRYQLQAVLGMAADDDDGAAATESAKRQKTVAAQHRQQPPGDGLNTEALKRANDIARLVSPPAWANGDQAGGDDILSDSTISEPVKAFVGELRGQESPGARKASEAMHTYAAGVIDGITGEQTHRQVFRTVFRREVTNDPDSRLAWTAAEMIFKYLVEQKTVKDANGQPVKDAKGKNVKEKNLDFDKTKVQHIHAIHAWAMEARGQMTIGQNGDNMTIDPKTGELVESGDVLFA